MERITGKVLSGDFGYILVDDKNKIICIKTFFENFLIRPIKEQIKIEPYKKPYVANIDMKEFVDCPSALRRIPKYCIEYVVNKSP